MRRILGLLAADKLMATDGRALHVSRLIEEALKSVRHRLRWMLQVVNDLVDEDFVISYFVRNL